MSFSPKSCPYSQCSSHLQSHFSYIKKSYFYIKRTHQYIRRYQCKSCRKTFSSRTFQIDYKHKKPDLNFKLAQLLVEGNSLRSSSRLLGMTYYNTYLKFLWLKKVIDLKKPELPLKARILQFDELETIHHTKCKPLSIALIVNEEYHLLGAQVAEMPAKGRLAEFSRRRYGLRKDERGAKLKLLFTEIKDKLQSLPALIQSDQKPEYERIVRNFFPLVAYQQYKAVGRVRLQDRLHEKLNKKRFDPLFAMNHQCALLRSHIKRLTRRSWCTTKKPENLQLHLDLFIMMQFLKRARF